MQRSNLAGAIFLGLFGLPFAGMGLAFAFTAARSGTNMPGLIGVLFGAFFACIGFGLMTAAVVGYKKANQQSALEEATPDKPWLWREDWASGRANGGDPKANITMWVFTAFWDFISIAATVAVFPKLVNGGDLRALLVFLFPVAGIFITAMAVRGTIRIQRFGPTSFWFDTFPFSPGVRVKGVIHLKLPTAAPHGIDLRLSCIRRVTTSSGKNRSVTELILWQDTRNVPAEHIIQGLSDAQVPVDFAIPADAYETDSNNSNDRLIWQLHAEADVPGVDFSDDYEIPVFRTQASAAAAGEASSSSAAFSSTASMSSAPQPEAPAPPPSHTHIVFSENEQGTSFYFPPLRSIPQALGIFVFATIWTGVVYFLWTHPQVPWIFRIVFSLFEILVIYMFLSVVFGSALLRVQNGVLQVRTAILGFGTLRTLPFSDVASISPLSQGRANTSGEVLYGINVKQSDGRNINVAASTLTQAEARWIVATLDRAMGRKQDTRVEFQSLMLGMPPQRLSTPGATGLPNKPPFKLRNPHRKFGFVSFGIWLLIVAGMLFSFFSRVHTTPSRPSTSAATHRKPIAKAPMTDEDATRIAALPVQGQAEELLERAINHDERALELFENSIEGWTSDVRLTDQVKQLQGKAMYSTDLRVRQAEADLNLAMEGWHRDREAVDLLLQRAETDRAYRPSAYYFLGMEAGRGIETDRVFGVLRERALNDSDPVVRQWAVEGLRFLKTNEALEVLFQSFTSDPSFTVRDRAGCNISDCGIFTRTQRMRYVPKLIDLAADSSQNSQMHTWAYMALNGVTDASEPSNANAWRKWYEEHGSEKMREFENLPWYQVRGDQ